MNYQDALTKLKGRKSKKIANNTYLKMLENGKIGLLYHETFVLFFYLDGDVEYQTGGFKTRSTLDRLNYGPLTIYQKNSVWCFHTFKDKTYTFRDGMIYNTNTRKIKNAASVEKVEKKTRETLAKIKKYAAAYAQALEDGKIDQPSTEDCFECYSRISGATDHYFTHFEEEYFVPSIVARAADTIPTSHFIKWYISDRMNDENLHQYGDWCQKEVKKIIVKFLKKEFGIPS